MNITSVAELKNRPWYKSYPDYVKQNIDLFNIPNVTLYDFLKSSAKYYEKSISVVYEAENLLLNYKELKVLVDQFASGLQHKIGAKKGDTIAVYARNYPEIIIAIQAIHAIGGIYVSCNPILVKEELKYQLIDSKAKFAIIANDKVDIFKEIVEENDTQLEKIIVFQINQELKTDYLANEVPKYHDPFIRFKDVFSSEKIEYPFVNPKEDLAAIIYTSGTTGNPKGVMVTHENAVASSILYHSTYTGIYPYQDDENLLVFKNNLQDLGKQWDYPIRYGIDNAMAAAPWTHMMGFIAHLESLIMAAMTIIPVPEMNVTEAFKIIQKWKVSFAGGAPQMMTMMIESKDIDQYDMSNIRVWTTGGAPCNVTLGTNFEKLIGGVIAEGYSLTEATMASVKNFSNKSGKRKWGSVGLPLPYTDVKIVSLEDKNKEVNPGEEGELVHNGIQVSKGYLNNPNETEECFKDGWIYTGDIARMDEDGYFYITGRLKDIIIYKGYNIAPRMLEETICKHKDIAECVVVGQKDRKAGEIPVAFVVLKRDSTITGKEILEFVNSKVAGYKKVRKIIILDRLPYSGTGKIVKKNLVQKLESGEYQDKEIML